MHQLNSSESTMYSCRCLDRDRKFNMESSFHSSNSEKLEIKLTFYDTREIWNWIPDDQDSPYRLGPITYYRREHEVPSFLVEKSWSRQDLREAIGKAIGNHPNAAELLTERARKGLREILKAGDSRPSYGILHLTCKAYARHHHVYGSEIITGGMVPAAESSFHLLEKCEDGDVGCEENQCSICLDGFAGKDLLRMPCSHVYHGDCIEKWLRRSHYCPLCRYQMPTE